MEISYKEYKEYGTYKKSECLYELVIINRMIGIMDKEVSNIDSFRNSYPTLRDFINKNQLSNVISHFGTLKEDDYQGIINNFAKYLEKRKTFSDKHIKQTDFVDERENVIAYQNNESNEERYVLSDESYKDEMKKIQESSDKFQSIDEEKNTQEIMKEMEQNKNNTLNLRYLNEFDMNELNSDEQDIVNLAKIFEAEVYKSVIKLDLENRIIVTDNGEIKKIADEIAKYTIKDDENNEIEHEANEMSKQKVLTYNNNNNKYSEEDVA